MNCFAASILVAISANLWRIAWNLPIGRPNASRSFAYSSVFSIIRSAPGVGARGGDQALALELPADVVEALADLAEDGVGRDADVVEGELAGVGGVHPHLLQLGARR